MKRLLLFLLLLTPSLSFGQDTMNVMFYNLYRFPTSPPANREFLLRRIIDTVQPDLLMTCELVNELGADHILNTSFEDMPDSFARTLFINSPDTIDPLQQMVFYNTRKLILIHQEALITLVRHINHYTFLLHTPDLSTDSVFIEVFVTHLKSSTGVGNEQFRLGMVDTFVNALSEIPQNHHVLFAGDFNLYNSSEPAYQKILDSTNHIRMLDPINTPGDWHDNASFSNIHTQATRITAAGFGIGGASGGMDDRFDFIMMSKNNKDNPEFEYIPNTYKSFGNNGDCFNKRIDDLNSDGQYSLSIRQILYNMSDHAPVVMQFQTEKHFVSSIHNVSEKTALLQLLNGNLIANYLNLKINIKGIQNKILIYSLSGKIVKIIPVPESGGLLHLDVQDLAQGLYFLKLAKFKNSTMKFIKR